MHEEHPEATQIILTEMERTEPVTARSKLPQKADGAYLTQEAAAEELEQAISLDERAPEGILIDV
jgi:hypothetical protein